MNRDIMPTRGSDAVWMLIVLIVVSWPLLVAAKLGNVSVIPPASFEH